MTELSFTPFAYDEKGRPIDKDGNLLKKDGTPRKKPGRRPGTAAAAPASSEAPKRRGRPPGTKNKPKDGEAPAAPAASTGAKRGPKPKPTTDTYKIYLVNGENDLMYVASVTGVAGDKSAVATKAAEDGVIPVTSPTNVLVLASAEVAVIGLTPVTGFAAGAPVESVPVPATDPEVGSAAPAEAPKARRGSGSKPTPPTPAAADPAPEGAQAADDNPFADAG